MAEVEEIKITALDPLEGIRKRPGVYIGSVVNADVLLREAIDNSIDECLANYANEIHIFANAGTDQKYSGCYDNGRGIPIGLMDHHGKMIPQFQVAVSNVHAGSKFQNAGKTGSIGLNGIGTTAINALSTEFYIVSKITKDNFDKSTDIVKKSWKAKGSENIYYCIHFQKGKLIWDEVITIEKLNKMLGTDLVDGYSTYTIFSPDPLIFHNLKVTVPIKNFYFLDAIMKYFYNKTDLKVFVNGRRLDKNSFEPYKYTFCKTIELEQWKTADEKFKDKMNKNLGLLVTFEFDPDLAPMNSEGSVNSLASYGKNTDLGEKIVVNGLRDYFHIDHNYITLGLKIKTVLMIGEAEFDSQTKERLTGIPGLGRNDWMKFSNEMYQICKKNPEIGEHIALLNEYAASMKQLTNKDLIKAKVYIEGEQAGAAGARLKPAKLRDALGKKREECRLWIVEGDSAGSGLIDMRDPLKDGILPLRGVPLNSANLDISDVLENDEMRDLISAVGMGTTEYNTDKVRYGKLIIATDADIDGLKIAALVLGCIMKHMPFLLEKEMVYIADSPLYKQGNDYFWKGEEDKMLKNKSYTRYKGLGEINSEQIGEIFFGGHCRYHKVTKEGADYALRLITNKDARKDLMREIGCLKDFLLK